MRCVLLGLLVLTLGGCGLVSGPDDIGPNFDEVAAIVNNTDLSAQVRREQLRDLGINDTTINGLLQGERTGNQFGGDLRSAYAKVSGDSYATLTPDEIQIFGDAARTSGGPNFTISDAAAQAIRVFFDDQGINNADDITSFLSDEDNIVPAAIPAGLLQQLFVDFDETEVLSQLP